MAYPWSARRQNAHGHVEDSVCRDCMLGRPSCDRNIQSGIRLSLSGQSFDRRCLAELCPDRSIRAPEPAAASYADLGIRVFRVQGLG